MKKHKRSFRKAKKQFARSPESFPKLRAFPDAWDIEPGKMKNGQPKSHSRKPANKVETFPKTTDSFL